jgi:hypothetical protein
MREILPGHHVACHLRGTNRRRHTRRRRFQCKLQMWRREPERAAPRKPSTASK